MRISFRKEVGVDILNSNMKKTFETDWLASRPVFYNEKTGAVSHSIHDVINYSNLTLHPEGFNNYLEFGYSVFGQTPIQDVKFLGACERITVDESGKLFIEKLPDPIESADRRICTPEEMTALLTDKVRTWEKSIEGPITLPLSGGYDSRLLGSMLGEPARVRAFTYGTSEEQHRSCEVIRAAETSKRLGFEWSFIPLHNSQAYLKEWDGMFGPAVHAHGMYHLDFFGEVRKKSAPGAQAFLSGIIGDLWAGHVHFDPITSEGDLVNLSRNHGDHADHTKSLLKSDRALRTAYFERHKNRINDSFYQPILFARMKLILLTYLYQIPEHFSWKPWSPFLDPEVALGMLSIGADERSGRSWQKKYFADHKLDIENDGLTCDGNNTLNLQIIQEGQLPPLDEAILGEVLDPAYVRSINSTLTKAHKKLAWKKGVQKILSIPKIYGLLRHLGMGELYGKTNAESKAYSAYCVIRPIELALKRRTT
ncbi:MAG: asparagine synthase-related protein [Patescibacteria group bacterium]